MKITKITTEQESRMPEWVDKWTQIGLSTEETRVEVVGPLVRNLYSVCKLDQLRVVTLSPSPIVTVIAGPVSDALINGANVWANVAANVRSNVAANVWSNVAANVAANVRANVAANVRANVWDKVRANVADNVRANVWDKVSDSWIKYRGGNLWTSWFAFISYIRDVLGYENELLKNFAAEEALAKQAGWYWPHSHFCIVTCRPTEIHLDQERNLHCDTGMAIKWPDGWGLWMMSGVAVDEQIVMCPSTQSIDQIHDEKNEDVRSIRIDRFGWTRYLKESGSQLRDSRRNEIEGTREALYVTPTGDCRLVATCPSGNGRIVCLGVPPTIDTCQRAADWLAGEKPFRTLART